MKGVVSSGSIDTSRAGTFALQQGGNAIDAMIASQLAAHVCEPMLTGFGGAGMASVRFNGQVYSIDMFTAMPGIGTDDSLPSMDTVTLDFGTTTQSFTVGEGSIAVPTIPAGLACLHKRFGSLPLDLLAKPAMQLCMEGFIVSKSCEYLLNLLRPIIGMSEMLTNWYTKMNSETLREGERCRTVEMLQDIRHFIDVEEGFFLKGQYLEVINNLHNSKITKKDFEKYNPLIVETKSTKIGDWKLYPPAMPSVGGHLIQNFTGWSETHKIDFLQKLSSTYVSINNSRDMYAKRINSLGNTTHISCVDAQGNAAAITTSLGETSGIVLPGTGVAMNNFLGETDVSHPLLLKKSGQRLLTMCSPLILESPSSIYALGSGGSSRIPGALIQVVKAILDGQSISDAVIQSRMHPHCQDQVKQILLEPMEETIVQSIQSGHPNIEVTMFEDINLYFGGVHIAGIDNGVGVGVGDPRRSGSSIVSI